MISEFIAMIGKRSIARATHFQVEILTVPELVRSTTGAADFQRDLKFLCVGVDMPGTQLLTQENRVYDLPQKFAYMKAHDEAVLTFRIDKDYMSRYFFEAWEDSCYNRNTGNAFYKSSYVGNIRISTMRDDGTCPYALILEDAFPTQISNISYSWESTGQIAQFTVSFAFTRKKSEVREALFTRSEQTGTTNITTNNDNIDLGGFDVMGGDTTGNLKDSVYSSINNAFNDRLTQKLAIGSSQLDPSTLKQMFKF